MPHVYRHLGQHHNTFSNGYENDCCTTIYLLVAEGLQGEQVESHFSQEPWGDLKIALSAKPSNRCHTCCSLRTLVVRG